MPDAPFPEPAVDVVEEARVYGLSPGGQWTELSIDSNGALEVVENPVKLDVVVANDVESTVTYIARALNSQAQDELITRVTDSSGNQIDPATAALEAALKSNDTDEFVSRLTDSAGSEVDPLNQDALEDVANDELRARVHDSVGVQIDPLNQDALEDVANDELRVRFFGLDDGGTLREVQAEQLDTAVAAATVGEVSYTDRALASQGTDELRADIQNSGIKVPTDQQDALEKKTNQTGLDLTVQQQETLTLGGYSSAHIHVEADASTTVTVEESFDGGSNYYEYASVGDSSYDERFTSGATDLRVTTAAAGSGGDTVDIHIVGKP